MRGIKTHGREGIGGNGKRRRGRGGGGARQLAKEILMCKRVRGPEHKTPKKGFDAAEANRGQEDDSTKMWCKTQEVCRGVVHIVYSLCRVVSKTIGTKTIIGP